MKDIALYSAPTVVRSISHGGLGWREFLRCEDNRQSKDCRVDFVLYEVGRDMLKPLLLVEVVY